MTMREDFIRAVTLLVTVSMIAAFIGVFVLAIILR
jgi:hypothetical protein